MLTKLFKLATEMDRKGLYTEADEIDQAIQLLAERAGLKLEDLVSLANELDAGGFIEAATMIDGLASEAAKKKFHAHKSKGDKKAPKGSMHKAPKAWFAKELEKVMKGNPKYSKERASKVVGDLWDNKLTDAKRKKIYERHGKHKNPNK